MFFPVEEEFCQWETFNATCPEGEVILMRTARYGRMKLGKCLTTDYFVGCSADVLSHVDTRYRAAPLKQISFTNSPEQSKLLLVGQTLSALYPWLRSISGIGFFSWGFGSFVPHHFCSEIISLSISLMIFVKREWATKCRFFGVVLKKKTSPWLWAAKVTCFHCDQILDNLEFAKGIGSQVEVILIKREQHRVL